MAYIANNFSVQCLPKNQHTLLSKFYRSHARRMRITQQADAWVVGSPTIIASLCLSPIANGYWLTSLLTAPEFRQQGVASFLVQQALANYPNRPIWLFCNPALNAFYSKLSFIETQVLPEQLHDRLIRYQQHKKLIAMVNMEHGL